MNRLANETSPYLLQHKDNPVDWRVWSPETLAEAKAQDKPILLSIGYAACHWCHVMAHESFEDPATAAIVNDLFVPIKVDREERPDIDAIYQNALGLLGQSGGWPLTMFLTPDGEPFWGGTYYPPVEKYGRPSFTAVMKRVSEVYRSEKGMVEKNTRALAAGLARLSEAAPPDMIAPDTLAEAARKIGAMVDPVEGGLGRAPKFPQSPVLALLWRGWKRTGDRTLRDGVLRTLDHMSQGGIYDHLGGGYARYATDDSWLVPHFEKMLYDNAQLTELLTWAWQETGSPLYAQRVVQTVGWILREMSVEGGGFAAALDADSEGEEGKFYVWTATEVERILGEKDAELFKAHYDVHWIGNWEGKTILNRSSRPELADPETETRLAASRAKLLEVRDRRVRPGRDHKVLADWNGMTIAALCLASGAFRRPDWLEAAKKAFMFVSTRMTDDRGRLFHSWCGDRTHPGTLDDYAQMIRAGLALFQSTGDIGYLLRAEQWASLADAGFLDRERGGYYFTAVDRTDLIARTRNAFDAATPSGNGVMVENLAALFYLTGKKEYSDKAESQIGAFAGEAVRNAVPLAAFLSGMDFFFNAVEIAILDGHGGQDLMAVVDGTSVPNRVLTIVADGEKPSGGVAEGKKRTGDQATAYVCVSQTCSMPITDPAALAEALAEATKPRATFAV